MFKISIFLKKVENKMNKKIKVILLLSIISTKLFSSNLEVEACKIGLKDRNGAIGISLLNGTEETGPCAAYAESKCLKATDPVACRRRRAACIFGYNSNSGFYSENTWCPNGIIMSNTLNGFVLGVLASAPNISSSRWFTEGNTSNDNRGMLDGVPVCDYGYKIGWGLRNTDLAADRSFNYWDTYQRPFNTDSWDKRWPILDVLWGQGSNTLDSYNVANFAQLINLLYNNSPNFPNQPNGPRQSLQGTISGKAAIQRIIDGTLNRTLNNQIIT